MDGLLFGGLAGILAAALLWWAAARLRKRSGLPTGRVIYSDTRTWRECPEPLYASSLNLTGKPDYLIRKWNYVLPVEVKSGPAPSEPYRSHVLQLAAYCYLVHETTDKRPPHGVLHYADCTFAIPYTRELERELEDTIAWMREDLSDGFAERSHNDPARCRSCSYAPYCDQKLA
jgi:CRISPR-associated exonuclease Cas4